MAVIKREKNCRLTSVTCFFSVSIKAGKKISKNHRVSHYYGIINVGILFVKKPNMFSELLPAVIKSVFTRYRSSEWRTFRCRDFTWLVPCILTMKKNSCFFKVFLQSAK